MTSTGLALVTPLGRARRCQSPSIAAHERSCWPARDRRDLLAIGVGSGEAVDVIRHEKGLRRGDVQTIVDVAKGVMRRYPEGRPLMWNPMGMGVFDVAMAAHFTQKAVERGVER